MGRLPKGEFGDFSRRYFRQRERIIIAEDELETHFSLVVRMGGGERRIDTPGELTVRHHQEKLNTLGRNGDMGVLVRTGSNEVLVGGLSTTFEYPPKETNEQVKQKTLRVLEAEFPEIRFTVEENNFL
ncbi:TPA: hypothetical protein DCQ19_03725 [Candidatus Shapirobacteria bacterium]|nr:hypothetical protein [Candidatus Shapirobacteria bacterium]